MTAGRRRLPGIYALAACALITAAATLLSLLLSEPSQAWRRISTLSIHELHVCRDGARFQLGRLAGEPPPPNPAFFDLTFFGAWLGPPFSTDPAESIAPEQTLRLPRRTATYISEDDLGLGQTDEYTATITIPWNRTIAAGDHVQVTMGLSSTTVLQVSENDDSVQACYLRSLAPSARMVGKGSVTAGGKTASYAYIMSCDPAKTSGAPFEVRFGTHRFRLTDVYGVSCADYSNVITPPAGFDTQTGIGTGTLDGTPGAYFEWTVVDGRSGGPPDSVSLIIRVPPSGSPAAFQGTAAPPGKFPGSTQTTGFNTAQAP